MDDVIKLLPCPFCGEDGEAVGTTSAGCRGYRGDQWVHSSVFMLAKHWNTRVLTLDRIKDQSHGG